MNNSTYKNELFLVARGAVDVGAGSDDRRELEAVLGGNSISKPTTSVDVNRDIGDFFYDLKPTRDAGVGLTERTIDYIVDVKGEPDWIREFRKNAYRVFKSKPLPTHWAGDELKEIDFDRIRYYLASGEATKQSWDDVPEEIKQTFERLGIPESERKFLAGVEAQFDSEAVYSNIKKAVSDQGVIFMGSTDALKERPDIFRKWFGKVIPTGDNKFSALNSAVFSGGSFIYVPPGVKVKHPLQAYFRINAENFGQFERTLIIAGRRFRGDVHGRLYCSEIHYDHAPLCGGRTGCPPGS